MANVASLKNIKRSVFSFAFKVALLACRKCGFADGAGCSSVLFY